MPGMISSYANSPYFSYSTVQVCVRPRTTFLEGSFTQVLDVVPPDQMHYLHGRLPPSQPGAPGSALATMFRLWHPAGAGERCALVGSADELGNWELGRAVDMKVGRVA